MADGRPPGNVPLRAGCRTATVTTLVNGNDFSRIASLRLVAKPPDHIFLKLIADKMNRTSMSTDLELEGVSKLVVRIRCVLRNVQSAKRGFSF